MGCNGRKTNKRKQYTEASRAKETKGIGTAVNAACQGNLLECNFFWRACYSFAGPDLAFWAFQDELIYMIGLPKYQLCLLVFEGVVLSILFFMFPPLPLWTCGRIVQEIKL
jgi:hypothetical protein